MCGIFGVWHRDGAQPEAGVLAAMAKSLRHRGPDGEGHWQPEGLGVAMGNTRLAILDIAHGQQPFVSDDGRIAVVQNGEIFNYVELAEELRVQGVRLRTSCDTEVILRLYEREGISCLRRLNGMFAIAVHDAREDALYLARDRIGVKPLYIADDGHRVLFASEIKGLRAAGLQPQIDLEAVHHYLSFNYIPPPWTIWQGVRHLMPGHWVRLTRQGVHAERWWDLSHQRETDHDFGAWAEEFLTILDDATRIRLRSDVPWGAFLSGRRRLQQHRGTHGKARDAARQDVLHRLCRPTLR